MSRSTANEGIQVDATELATQLRTRGLVRTIVDLECWHLNGNTSELIETIAHILNTADAPPIVFYIEDALEELERSRLFLVENVLCDLIPLLNVEQDILHLFIMHLLDAGCDGALIASFGEWTKKDPKRPNKVYKLARNGDNLALRLLSTVLLINSDVDESIIFAKAHKQEAKLAAISALGSMELGERYAEVIDILLQCASSEDEDICLRSIEAGYRAAAKRKAYAPVGFEKRLEQILFTFGPSTIHFAVNLLQRHREGLTEDAIVLCLSAAAHVDPDNTSTISLIDHALYQLVSVGRTEQVIPLLSELIDRSKGRITFDTFQSTYHALNQAGSDVLGSAVVYWLLHAGAYTRKCLAYKVCGVGSDVPSFSIPSSSLPPDPSDQLFLCRKAIGWFFIDPLAVVTILLAVLRNGSPDIKNDVLELIYDPLLLSYGGKLKSYLEQCVVDGSANSSGLAELLARKTAFDDALEGIERLVELHPNEMQREVERVQWHEQMERSIPQGSRKSIFDDIFTKQYILYGRSSLTSVHTGEGKTNLTEIEMTSFSITSELPLLNIVDPIGLDHMLFNFRLEQRESR
ncbi:hypothetical protein [Aeromonas caviae]|uniref:hypothetical protein n=1 Tax=Aeromonas caviae TaxID=648 RepID=UPI0029D633EF|nr:hypothetical protein [Aeromonas caviae]MDX7598829.1 hypothetical protein [Aeromonas caviae]MDX7805058.1 hypothetical protein [Aeromonas caviae]MDY7800319.1 hypothetical protein [Aeromonas caviae]MDY7892854.1 hypothetical protein [Aeromonas caviae]